MAELDLKAIQARVDAATPGPWSADPTGTVCADADLLDSSDGPTLPANGPMEVAECYRSESPQERAKNAEFVAHARSDVPALLAEVRGLRDAVKLLGQHNQDDYDLALIRIAELEGQVEDLTGQVAGRDETIQRVRDLHREWVLYDEDACTHEDDDHQVRTIAGVGNICADAVIKPLCRECCTDDGEFQSRHCVEDHTGTPCWPCPTKIALDGDPADDGRPSDA